MPRYRYFGGKPGRIDNSFQLKLQPHWERKLKCVYYINKLSYFGDVQNSSKWNYEKSIMKTQENLFIRGERKKKGEKKEKKEENKIAENH